LDGSTDPSPFRVADRSYPLRHTLSPRRHTHAPMPAHIDNLPSPAAAPRTIWLPGLRADLTSRPDPPIVLGHTDLPPSMAAVGSYNGGTAFGLGRTVHIYIYLELVAYVGVSVTPTATYIGLCEAIRSSNQPRWWSIECNPCLSCSSAAKYVYGLVRTLSAGQRNDSGVSRS
jgi:hypothetical protein